MVSSPWLLLARPFLERGERFRPESIEPAAQRLEAPRVHRIEPPGALGAIDHQSCVLENLQVLGDGGTADVHSVRDLSDRACAAAQALEDPPSGRISQRIQDALSISCHLP
jgi:hypothetical protein